MAIQGSSSIVKQIFPSLRPSKARVGEPNVSLKLRCLVALAGTFLLNISIASPSKPVEGVDYISLELPQTAVTVGNRVEVIEFILFHCPHCATLDPLVRTWATSKAGIANVRLSHATFRGPKDPEVRLFHTLEKLGELNTLIPKVFNSVQKKELHFLSDNSIFDWAKQSGLDSSKFQDAWNSPAVLEMTSKAPQTVKAYGLTYAPAFIVDGRFLTSPYLIKKNNPGLPVPLMNNALLNVLNFLIEHSKKNPK